MKDGIKSLDPTDDAAVEQVSRLHAELLPGSPIARLGRRFMSRFYYRTLVADGLIDCHLDYVDGQAAGFIAFTAQPSRFMVEGLRRHWLFLSRVLLKEVLSDPRRLRVILWTLNHMRRHRGPSPGSGEGEILSFGVAPEFRSNNFVRLTGRRVSSELFARAREYFRASGIQHYRAVVESENREALLFYHGQGCRPKQPNDGAPGTVVIACDEIENADESGSGR